MKVVVTEAYTRPYENPIAIEAGEALTPDFNKPTDIGGWVWCTARDGRSGWTPSAWLVQSGDAWHIDRDFNAIELTVMPGEVLEVVSKESGFYWVRQPTGEKGWVPCGNVTPEL